MNWVFILIAFTSQGATVEKVPLDSAAQCVAYGRGYTGRPELREAYVQVAQCVSLRSGAVIPVTSTGQKSVPVL